MSDNRVTIYDIARASGVSIATVSRVLNEHPRVAPATRERVLRVAARLNYRPHVAAQHLARQSVSTVAAVIPMMANYFYVEVLRGMNEALEETDFDLIVYSAPTPDKVLIHVDRAIQRGRSSGVLLFSTAVTSEMADRLRLATVPVVLVDAFHEQFDSISVDNRRGGYLATQHFIEQGYRHIGMIAAHPASLPAQGRYQGYRKALAEANIPFEKRRVVWSANEKQHGYLEEEGARGLERLLDAGLPLEAVFVASDIQALGVLQAARERGLKVPEELAVIGFDDIAISRYVGLSTMRQPMREMGQEAIRKLMQRIEEPQRPIRHTVYAPELVHRRTCGMACPYRVETPSLYEAI